MVENITKKQHFVPKFYLKRFANDKNFVDVLDLEKKELLKPYPYSGICYEEFYYAANTGKPDQISQDLEELFKRIEDSIAPKLDSIIESVYSSRKMDEEGLSILAVLLSMLWIRGVYMRKQTQRMAVDMAKQSMAILASHKVNFPKWMEKMMKEKNLMASEEDIEKTREILKGQEYELKFNNAVHLNMIKDIERYAGIFF